MRSAIVLVGGEARRANGMEKYFFTYQGRTFIERLKDSLSLVVDEIVIVAKNPEQCSRFSHLENIHCVNDEIPGLGPIGGLRAGVATVSGNEIFVCGCDMPCVSPDVVEYLFTLLESYDAVIPAWDDDMIEPLHAVYRRSPLDGYLRDHTSLSLRDMIQSLNCRYIHAASLRHIDPGLVTFTNINNIEELKKIDSLE